MRLQVADAFTRNEGTKPAWAPWTAENSLFRMKPCLGKHEADDSDLDWG